MLSFFSMPVREKGQGLVEYAIILALVAIVVIGAMRLLGPKVGCTYSGINDSLPGESDSTSGACTNSVEAPSGPQDFGSTQWKNGFDTATPINNFCGSEGPGANYNLYSVNAGSYTYFLASGYPWTGSQYTFINTGTCS